MKTKIVFFIFVLGVSLASCSKKEEVVEISAIFALSGDYAAFGQRAKNGVELATEENKDQGNYNLIIKYEDSQGIPKNAVAIMNKLSDVDKVKYVLGPLSSSEVLSIAPIAEKRKTIILTPVSSSPALTNAGDYIFRNVVSDIYEGAVAASFVKNELGKQRAGILFLNNDYGVGLNNSFKAKYLQLGGSIVIEESFDVGSTDFRTQILKIMKIIPKPEICVLCGYTVELARILKQSKELGLNISFISFSPTETPEMIKIAGEAAEGVYYTYQGFDTKSSDSTVKRFIDKYHNKYKEDPDIFAALSYDAMNILKLAIEKGGNNVDSVKKALYNIRDFDGVMGNTTFDSNGDVIKPLGIKQIKNHTFVWIKRTYK